MPTTELNGPSRLYISVVVAAGLCVLLESIYSLLRAPVEPNWLVLAVLTLLSGYLHRSDTRNPRETLCFRDFRFRGSSSLRPTRGDDDRRPRYARHLFLARAPNVTAAITCDV